MGSIGKPAVPASASWGGLGGTSMTATVKEIIAGDTFVLVGQPKGGPPPEKRLCLSSIQAPKVAMKSQAHETRDEPFGWPSREFARVRLIGRAVSFGVEYELTGRQFGWLKVQEGEELLPEERGVSFSLLLLREGLAKLKTNRNPPAAADYDDLQAAEEAAKDAKKNLWSDEAGAGLATVRDVQWAVGDAAAVRAFYSGREKSSVCGLVEYIRDGGCFRVLLEGNFYAAVLLAGVQADGFKREPTQDGADQIVAQPFAAEARYFMEVRFLNRDVTVRLEGCDDFGNLFGSVVHSNGADAAILLLKNGFTRLVDWSAKMTKDPNALRAALREAQKNKLRKWKDYEPAASSVDSSGTCATYQAKVVEVVSGDAFQLATADGAERRVYLASIRCPRLGGKAREDDPGSVEAKEFARKKVIGKTVKVLLQYIREPTPAASGAALPPASDSQGRLHFVRLLLDGDKLDLSELLVKEGLAKTVAHRLEDDRADNFEALSDLERDAAAAKRGVHKPEGGAVKRRPVDLLGPANVQRAKAFLAQLSKPPRIDVVVDHVVNAARFKLRVPSQDLVLSFTLAGLRVPATARPAGVGGPHGRSAEPFADEALAFTKSILMQRDAAIHVDSCDRGGTFIGSLWLKDGTNLACKLLEMGYAYLVDFSAAQSPHRDELYASEAKAKAGGVRLWSTPAFLEAQEGMQADRDVDETFSALVTHVQSIKEVYVQDERCPRLAKVQAVTATFESTFASEEYSAGGPPRRGEIVLAKFTADEQWYRARVDGVGRGGAEVRVAYVDYGNGESLPLARVRRLPEGLGLKAIPAAAKTCCLAGLLEAPDFQEEATSQLSKMAGSAVCHVKVERIEGGKLRHVILTTQQEQLAQNGTSLNEKLVLQGLARLDKKSNTKLFSRLKKAEDSARKSHVNVWRYGDIGDDEDQEEFPSLGRPKNKK
eukprot:GHVT01007923.1.p1 GENE.GHVT01007923.1~~GHVT01007923.1.p1  ORF type:complete len:939 (-),score=274.40 GHVT01007923.1:393-3209(-)